MTWTFRLPFLWAAKHLAPICKQARAGGRIAMLPGVLSCVAARQF